MTALIICTVVFAVVALAFLGFAIYDHISWRKANRSQGATAKVFEEKPAQSVDLQPETDGKIDIDVEPDMQDELPLPNEYTSVEDSTATVVRPKRVRARVSTAPAAKSSAKVSALIAEPSSEKETAPVSAETPVANDSIPKISTVGLLWRKKVIPAVVSFLLIFGIIWLFIAFLSPKEEKKKTEPGFGTNLVVAEQVLSPYLKYPDTLEFSYFDEDWEFVNDTTAGKYKMESHFTCQNFFGVPERHDFIISVTYNADFSDYTLNFVYLDGEKVFPQM